VEAEITSEDTFARSRSEIMELACSGGDEKYSGSGYILKTEKNVKRKMVITMEMP
jgi:chemotaxis methyl-accepting protein methylase